MRFVPSFFGLVNTGDRYRSGLCSHLEITLFRLSCTISAQLLPSLSYLNVAEWNWKKETLYRPILGGHP